MAVDALRWRHPGTISVLCTVADRDVPALRASLSRGGPALRVDELPTVHFLRMFVIDPDHDLQGRPLPARLVLSIVFDGTAQRVVIPAAVLHQ